MTHTARSLFRFAAPAAVLALVGLSAPASAQRDPAYAAARAAGQVGERMDGYLGVISGGPDVRAMAEKINIQRRANYTERAAANGATIQEYAFTQGCILILRTAPGEKYQTPGGAWETRGSGAPERDPRCP